MKKIMQRICVACGMKKDKNELIRLVKPKDNEMTIDKTGKLPGRGAYICCNVNCLEKTIKLKRLEHALKTKASDEIYEKIRGVIFEQR